MRSFNSVALLRVWEECASQPPLERALWLLHALKPEKTAEEWARLSIGQRDAELLSFQEELFGPGLETVADCPECNERLEVGFTTTEIRVRSPQNHVRDDSERLELAGYEVQFRVPTSADLLALARNNPDDARGHLLRACIYFARYMGEPIDTASLPEGLLTEVIEKMAEADPQANVRIALSCVRCSHEWSMPFDCLAYLWGEIDDWARRLLSEVHELASVYGWSESDIIAMSPRRRGLYLDLVGA
jgi:hypothetical protein